MLGTTQPLVPDAGYLTSIDRTGEKEKENVALAMTRPGLVYRILRSASPASVAAAVRGGTRRQLLWGWVCWKLCSLLLIVIR